MDRRFTMSRFLLLGCAVALGGFGSPAAAEPAWLSGKPLFEWIAIAGTEHANMIDFSEQVKAGLTNSAGQNIGYGSPKSGIFAYSGGTLRKEGSEVLIHGGGGAGAWAGNDVHGLSLEADQPSWRTRIKPAPVSEVWARGTPATPTMRDGTPNAQHSYYSPVFIDATDKFMTFGVNNVWQIDNGLFRNVFSAPLTSGQWDTSARHPNIPQAAGYDAYWICKNPVNEDVYVSTYSNVEKYSVAANSWTNIIQNESGCDRGVGAMDPGRNVLLKIGLSGAFRVKDLATSAKVFQAVTRSGPYADSIPSGYNAGMEYNPDLDCFVLFLDDGHLYTLRYVSLTEWSVDRLALSGTAPEYKHSGIHGGGFKIYGRMRYVPNLHGIVIIQAFDRPAYFVRTGIAASVEVPGTEPLMGLLSFPNPCAGTLSLSFYAPASCRTMLRIFSLDGRLQKAESIEVRAGNNSTSAGIGDLTPGTYAITLSNGAFTVKRLLTIGR